jgi:hypothetical protein
VNILLTALATILGGALAFALGQLILLGTVRPALELKRLIGAIAFDLDFYGTNDLFKGGDLEKEWRNRLASHAISLREKLNLIVWYRGFQFILRLPSAVEALEASRELQLEAHRSATIEGWSRSRAENVKKLLRIKY